MIELLGTLCFLVGEVDSGYVGIAEWICSPLVKLKGVVDMCLGRVVIVSMLIAHRIKLIDISLIHNLHKYSLPL